MLIIVLKFPLVVTVTSVAFPDFLIWGLYQMQRVVVTIDS